jgi:hypothetical protein
MGAPSGFLAHAQHQKSNQKIFQKIFSSVQTSSHRDKCMRMNFFEDEGQETSGAAIVFGAPHTFDFRSSFQIFVSSISWYELISILPASARKTKKKLTSLGPKTRFVRLFHLYNY